MTRLTIRLIQFASLVTLYLLLSGQATAQNKIRQGELQALDAEEKSRGFCPLKHTDVKAKVSGSLARVTVTQEFQNPFDYKIEAIYVFPLPQQAAVDDLQMIVGNRTVRGQIKRREDARALYDQARASGRVANLLDQERPNIFRQSVANILPGESVRIVISYVETLKYEDEQYEFAFPMVVGPRYIPNPMLSDEENATKQQAFDASRVTSPVVPERPGHEVSLEISLETGLPIESVESQMHEVEMERPSIHSALIRLKKQNEIPNQDFILHFSVAGEQMRDALLAHRSEKGGYFTLILQPPNRVAAEDVSPKELIFVLDTSGSMEGMPIETAKRAMKLALEGLYPHDTFNLITFAGDTNILFPEPVPATQENLSKAYQFLESRKGGGGTEMMKAIRAALDPSDNQNHIRIVCFMTDGFVGNDMGVIAEVQRHPQARIFAFGIGNSVNRFLLGKMAEYGRGEVAYVPTNSVGKEEAALAAKRFHERIRNPLLTDISIDWSQLPVTDVYPKRIPDLFGARPLILSGRFTGPARGIIRLRGQQGGQPFQRDLIVELPALQPAHDVLATLWARQKIDDLMAMDFAGIQRNNPKEEIQNQITALGLEFRLMTQFTSFVAVEELPTSGTEPPQPIAVPTALPVGTFGSSTETVTITSNAMLLTADTSLSTSVNHHSIADLPLNGRRFADLVPLATGTVAAPSQTSLRQDALAVFAGLSTSTARISVDGLDHTNDVTGDTLPMPSTQAVEETHVVTSGLEAGNGRTGSAVIQITGKTGTNELHGSASFLGRHKQFSALPATSERQAVPPFRREQYSAAVGGPIVRDRAFWFGAMEYSNQNDLMAIGERDLTTRSIRQQLNAAPLDDLFGAFRVDLNASDRDQFSIRYFGSRGDNVTPSILQRTIGSARQSQSSHIESDVASLQYTRTISPRLVNGLQFGFNRFASRSDALSTGLQMNFSNMQDGAPFRVSQVPRQTRWQFSDDASYVFKNHSIGFGVKLQQINAAYDSGFARTGWVEFAEDFASLDRNRDGTINDQDLLFIAAIRPNAPMPAASLSNTHIGTYVQDAWRIRPNLTINMGLRYQLDTNEQGGHFTRDTWSPRIGLVLSFKGDRIVLRGNYGLLYDRIPLQYALLAKSQSQLLTGHIPAFATTAGNVGLLNANGQFLPSAPTLANPFAGAVTLWANSPGLTIVDPALQNPRVQQVHVEAQFQLSNNVISSVQFAHSQGARFPFARTTGSLTDANSGVKDRMVTVESAARAQYDALIASLEKRFTNKSGVKVIYTLSKSFDYTNGDQLPFFTGIVDPNRLNLEYGPSAIDQRHRLAVAGAYELWRGFRATAIWSLASGVPMNILLPDASSRVPLLQRNAGGRLFSTGAELNRFLQQINSGGGINGAPLPLVGNDATFNDRFNSVNLQLAKVFKFANERKLVIGGEVFNTFNTTNVLGLSLTNYSGFNNVLARDSNNPNDAGYLKSSSFGRAATTAGTMFGSGAPRAVQLLIKFSF